MEICFDVIRHLAKWINGSEGKSSPCKVLWPKILWQWRYNGYSFSRDLARPCGRRVEQHYGQKPVMTKHELARFGGHRHCDSGDIMILVCRVILQDNVIKRSYDFIGRSLSRQVKILPRLVAIGTLIVEIQWFQFVT